VDTLHPVAEPAAPAGPAGAAPALQDGDRVGDAESLLGRRDELLAIDRVLDAARMGLSASIVLRGAPGTGKSSLLDYAAAAATDFAILAVSGTESETDWGYSGLRRLLQPLVPRLGEPCDAHVGELRAALGLADAAPSDRVGVGLGVLAVLSEFAAVRPVLCIVDDAQWLDAESVDAMALVGRRIHADRLAVVFATRTSTMEASGIPVLTIEGLAEAPAVALLERSLRGPVDRATARRVVAETRGVPLAIRELAGGLGREGLAAAAASPEPLPIVGHLKSHFLRSIRALPEATQRSLLVRAADSSGDPEVVARASAALGAGSGAFVAAQEAGILGPGRDPEFRHPLIRSAVYASAPVDERRRVHRALAAAIAPDLDPDRHAWHLAAAADGADRAVVGLLDEAAGRSSARGAYASAGRFHYRAAELTMEPSARVERLLAASEAYLAGGVPIRARTVLEQEAGLVGDPVQRARVDRLLGATRYALGEAIGTTTLLKDAAAELAGHDPALARAALLQAMAAARVPGRLGIPGETFEEIARLAGAVPPADAAEPTAVDLLVDGDAALFLESHDVAVPLLRRAIELLRAGTVDDEPDGLLWFSIGCWAAAAMGDVEALRGLAIRHVALARGRASPEGLAHGLIWLGVSDLIDGSLAAARSHFAERSQLMEALGRGPADVGRLMMAAWAGREAATLEEAAVLERHAVERSHGWMLSFVEYSVTVLELGRGNYRAAFDAAGKDYQDNPFLSMLSFPDLVEAAVRCGELDAATSACSDLERRAVPSGTAFALGQLDRCRALLAADADADALYQRSLDHFGACRGELQAARAHLLYGEWLRRRKRRRDAREQLRRAHHLFESMGAEGFARRARVELAATGVHARRRNAETLVELTPQEGQVAALVATGATNGEIASQLFISRSTVDYHLGKVYRKLGISSRRELRAMLPPGGVTDGTRRPPRR
jgi:DNA-binding CsgD family transcriptional regulator